MLDSEQVFFIVKCSCSPRIYYYYYYYYYMIYIGPISRIESEALASLGGEHD